MATTFYFDVFNTAPVSPAINAAWTKFAANVYRMVMPSKTFFARSGVTTNFTTDASTTTSPQKMIALTVLSQPLIAQTINSGATFSLQMRGSKNASAPTGLLTMYVRLCDENGTNLSEIGNASNATNLTTTLTNRTVTVTLGSNKSVGDNQRLIFEIGEAFNAGSANHTATINTLFNSGGNDLPVDNTTTSALNCYITSSQTLLFRTFGMAI